MTILFTHYDLAQGGAERRLLQLMLGLSNRGYDVHCFLQRNIISFAEAYSSNVQYHIFDKNTSPSIKESLDVLIGKIHPDIIQNWATTMSVPLLILRIRHHFKYIDSTITTCNKYSKRRGIFYKEWLSLHLADHVVSNSMAGLLARNAPLRKARVIYNGYDYKRQNNIKPLSDLLDDLQVSSEQKIVSMAVRFHPHKDVQMFIDVAKKIESHRSDIVFFIIGDGPQREYFECYCRDNNIKVRFLGHRTDVESIIHISTLCVLCSRHEEGISNWILESMADGKPVIATVSGGTNEIVLHGQNGFIVPKGDVEGMATRIEELVDDENLYSTISIEAVNTVHKKFLLSIMIDEYIKLYNELLK